LRIRSDIFAYPSTEQFILNNFVQMMHSSNKDTTLFIQDGDPSQNSAKARKALNRVGATLLKIPPRSPDINPIENLFNTVKRKLREQAIREQITHETFTQFANRVKTLICNVKISSIDNLIASMPKRMLLIIKGKGNRTKY
jgi:transposase